MIPQLKEITENIIVAPHGMLNKESLRKSYLGRDNCLQYLKKNFIYYSSKKESTASKSFSCVNRSRIKRN